MSTLTATCVHPEAARRSNDFGPEWCHACGEAVEVAPRESTSERIRREYGVQETNGLDDGLAYHRNVDHSRTVTLAEVARHGARISRVRILAENWGGILRCDVSYIHASRDGKVLPVNDNGLRDAIGGDLWGKNGLKARLIEWAKAEGVSAKAIGLLDEGNWSILK